MKTYEDKVRDLVVEMLRVAARKLSCASCNDYSFPEDWEEEEIRGFIKQMYVDNGTPEEYNGVSLMTEDWWVASHLANLVEKGKVCL